MANSVPLVLDEVAGLQSHCDTLRQRWASRTTDQSGGPTIQEYFQPIEATLTNPSATWLGSGTFIDRALAHLRRNLQAPPLVVVGEVGSGKSTLCLKLALDILERSGSPVDPRPLLVPVGELKPDPSPADQVSKWVGDGVAGGPCLGVVLEQHVRSGDVVLFLDGLDEGHPRLGIDGIIRLLDWAVRLAKTSRCRIVVTSRLEYYKRVASRDNRVRQLITDATVAELNPFGAYRIESMCAAWFGNGLQGVGSALALLPSVPLLRHPLFLARALSSAQAAETGRPSVARFLNDLLSYIVQEREETKDLPTSLHSWTRYDMLKQLCVAALRERKLDVSQGTVRMEISLVESLVSASSGAAGVGATDSAESAQLELIARTILVQEDRYLRVVHPWLFECLIANEIAEGMSKPESTESLLDLLQVWPLRELPLVRRLVAAYALEDDRRLERDAVDRLLESCQDKSAHRADATGFALGNLLSLLVAGNPAILKGRSFRGSRIAQSNLSGADLTATDFSTCDLTGTALWGTNLSDANFAGAKLGAAEIDFGDLGSVLDVAFFPGDVYVLALFARGYRVWDLRHGSVEAGADWRPSAGSGGVAAPLGDWVFVARPQKDVLELISSDGLNRRDLRIVPLREQEDNDEPVEPISITGLCWGGNGEKVWLRTRQEGAGSRRGALWVWVPRTEVESGDESGCFEQVPLEEGFPVTGPFACGRDWAAVWDEGRLLFVTRDGWCHRERVDDARLTTPMMLGMSTQLVLQLAHRKLALYAVELIGPKPDVERTSTVSFPTDVYTFDVRRDGLLAAAGSDRRIHLWRPDALHSLGPQLPGSIRALRFSQTGRYLACAVESLADNSIELHSFECDGDAASLRSAHAPLSARARLTGADFRGCVGIDDHSLRERLQRAGALV